MSLDNLKFLLTSLRRKQISKILKYGREILNLKVQFKNSNEMGDESGGYIAPEGKEKGLVTVEDDYYGLQLILILLHEFGHHIDFLKRGYKEDEEKAYTFYPESKKDAPCPAKEAKVIYFIEEQAIKYSQELAIYLDLKLPRYAVLKDMFYNRLALNSYLKNGFTTSKTRAKIRSIASGMARKEVECERKRNKKGTQSVY